MLKQRLHENRRRLQKFTLPDAGNYRNSPEFESYPVERPTGRSRSATRSRASQYTNKLRYRLYCLLDSKPDIFRPAIEFNPYKGYANELRRSRSASANARGAGRSPSPLKYELGDEIDLGGTGPLDELDIIQSCRMARLSAYELREQLKFKDSLNKQLHTSPNSTGGTSMLDDVKVPPLNLFRGIPQTDSSPPRPVKGVEDKSSVILSRVPGSVYSRIDGFQRRMEIRKLMDANNEILASLVRKGCIGPSA